jgi:hypothetical protein
VLIFISLENHNCSPDFVNPAEILYLGRRIPGWERFRPSLGAKTGEFCHNPGFDRFTEISSKDAYFVQLNCGYGPSVIVLADIPFLSEGVQRLNNLVISFLREFKRLNDPEVVCVLGRPVSSGGQRRFGALESRVISDIETPVSA